MVQSNFESKVKIQDIIDNQIPEFILAENPKFSEFLRQYYISQESQGGNIDLIENLVEYLKLDNLTPDVISGSSSLTQNVSITDTTIYVNNTDGFPNYYGLIQIDSEIITYKEKLNDRFTGCIRGFSGINSYDTELVFSSTQKSTHLSGTKVTNLSVLFLQKFYEKIKFTFLPGLEKVDLHKSLNINNFIKNSSTFYRAKGSKESFRILFNALYGIEPTVVDLETFLFKSSGSKYKRRKELIFESLDANTNPLALTGYQVVKTNDSSVFGSVSEAEIFTRNNKSYYKFYIFVGYDDSNSESSGEFLITPSTKVVEKISSTDNAKVITVDSTVGFPKSGSIFYNQIEIFYTDKSVNQFFGCYTKGKTYVDLNINKTSILHSNDTYFGYENGDKTKKVVLRLLGTINNIVVNDSDSEYIFSEGDKLYIKELGNLITSGIENNSQVVANSLIYNTSSRYQLNKILNSESSITLSEVDKSSLKVGDYVEFLERNTEIIANRRNSENQIVQTFDNQKVESISFNTGESGWEIEFDFDLLLLDPLKEYDIRRKLKIASSSSTSSQLKYNNITCDVTNLYSENNENFYVASNSLPSYVIEKNIFSYNALSVVNFNNIEQKYESIEFSNVISLLSGDKVFYSYTNSPIPGLTEGEYYIKVSSNKKEIKLYRSRSFIAIDKFLYLGAIPNNSTHTFTLLQQKTEDGKIYPQKLFKKIKPTVSESSDIPDPIGTETIGILANGVEIYSYVSNDKVFYGPLESVKILNSGEQYDVINPPKLEFSYGNAKLQPVVQGYVDKVYVDPQEFNIDTPIEVKITGGNGKGAVLEPIISLKSREIFFDARELSNGGGLSLSSETITFLTKHNLVDGQKIIYDINSIGNQKIGLGTFQGSDDIVNSYLENNSVFYTKVINDETIQIYPTFSDYQAGINTVGFTTFGNLGVHKFKTEPKKILESIKVINGGEGFTNRKLIVKPSGISTYNHTVNFINHGFLSGELISYDYETSNISGISTLNQYYVLKVNNDSFRLCNAGVAGTDNQNYVRQNYVKFSSTGSGYQYFNYPKITTEIVYSSQNSNSISTVTTTPVVKGSIVESYLYENGSNYGSSVLNLENTPSVKVLTGEFAKFSPVIIGGKITKVLISYSGLNYYSVPEIIVESKSGIGAILRATISNGKVNSVIVINGGYGYDPNDTIIKVVSSGKNAVFLPKIRSLTLNNSYKYGTQTQNYRDPSYEFLRKTKDNNLQYVVTGYSEILKVLFNENGQNHSPIIGWSYDGIPIYGPFGYSNSSNPGEGVRLIKSGYSLTTIENRVSVDEYPLGFFIDDYKFTNSGDLDEYNGRFCKTPEYPNGAYVYFATAILNPENKYVGFFPYFIGKNYRNKPILENIKSLLDQNFNFNESNLLRNTLPYKSGQKYGRNDFIPYNLDQISEVTNTVAGQIQNIKITNAGNNYKVDDILYFNNDETSGYGLDCIVETVKGKKINKIESKIQIYENAKLFTYKDNNFYVKYQPNYDIVNNSFVTLSGLTSSFSHLNGEHLITLSEFETKLSLEIPNGSVGVVTDIYLQSFPRQVSIGSSIKIINTNGDKYFTILNYFDDIGAIRVERSSSGLCTANSAVVFLSDIITNRNDEILRSSNENYLRYFNPVTSVGVGTWSGLFANKTIYNGLKQLTISVPTQSIYLPNHGFFTGQKIILRKSKTNAGSILVSKESDSTPFSLLGSGSSEVVYAINKSRDYIGISTLVADSQNTNGLYFRSEPDPGIIDGTDYHKYKYSFESTYDETLCNVTNVRSTVSISTSHNLKKNDFISLTVKPQKSVGIGSTSFVNLEYIDSIKSIGINKLKFTPNEVDLSNNRLNIVNHNLSSGDKVFYISTSIIGGLSTGSYYVYKIDVNNINLCESYIDSTSNPTKIIKFTSVGIGTQELTLVQPRINVVRNNDLVFKVSDASLKDYNFKFYFDENLKKEFVSVPSSSNLFSIVGVNTIGVSSDAFITLKYSDSLPDKLYYSLEKNNELVSVKDDIKNSSEIYFIDSEYSGTYEIFNVNNTSFDIKLKNIPEESLYNYSDCKTLEYSTSSKFAFGPVSKIKIINSGSNYKNIPYLLKTNSTNGVGLDVIPVSNNIGKLETISVKSTGFEYSVDKTLSPKPSTTNIVKISFSNSLLNVTVNDGGKGYASAPNLVIVDSVTGEKINKGLLVAEMSGSSSSGNKNISKVSVQAPVNGLPSNPVTIKSVNNSNGIIIDRIESSRSGIMTCLIRTPILGFSTDPFLTGDEVFLENIEIVPNSGRGFNSENHGYQFFKVTDYVQGSNPGRMVIKIPELYGDPGEAILFQVNTFATAIKKTKYPSFSVKQDYSLFLPNEDVILISGTDRLVTNLVVGKSNKNYLKLLGNYELQVGDVIQGSVSGYLATIEKINSFNGTFLVAAENINSLGWDDEVGKLSNNNQYLPDNDYYQNLSYTIKTTKTWNESSSIVNSLVHPIGTKNFIDTQIASSSTGIGSTSALSSSVDITQSFISESRVDTIKDLDVVTDFDVNLNSSRIIKFKNLKLLDYFEAKTNRVLQIDDISGLFSSVDDNEKRLDTIILSLPKEQSFGRFLFQVKSSNKDLIQNNVNEIQFTEIICLKDSRQVSFIEKSTLTNGNSNGEEPIFFDSKIAEIKPIYDDAKNYYFTFLPKDPYDTDYEIKILSTSFLTNSESNSSIDFDSTTVFNTVDLVLPQEFKNILSLDSSKYSSFCSQIQILNRKTFEMNYVEIYASYDGNDISYANYYFDSKGNGDLSPTGDSYGFIGSFGFSITNSGLLKFDYLNETTLDNITVSAKTICFNNNSSVGIASTYRFKTKNQKDGSERTAIISSGTTSVSTSSTIFSYNSQLFSSIKSIVKVSIGNTTCVSQLMVIHDNLNSFITEYPVLLSGDNNIIGIGTFSSSFTQDKFSVIFKPYANFENENISIRYYNEIFYSFLDEVNFPQNLSINPLLEKVNVAKHFGLNSKDKNRLNFNLKYRETSIFAKTFDPGDSDIFNSATGVFTIPNHFFSTGERLIYTPGSTFIGVGQSAMGIAPGSITDTGIATSRLPSSVYAIKIDNDKFKIALTKINAEGSTSITFTDVGEGNAHTFEMFKKNEKSLITINNLIQYPLSYTGIAHSLFGNGGQIGVGNSFFTLSGISSIKPTDLLKIDNEYMKVLNVGIGTSNSGPITFTYGDKNIVEVERGFVGTSATSHLDDSEVKVFTGSYNISKDQIYFTHPPRGNIFDLVTNDERNLKRARASFSGRVFLRKDYSSNVIFDDISRQFTGVGQTFILKSQGINTVGLGTTSGNGILLINGIYQTPLTQNVTNNNFEIIQDTTLGISSVVFSGIRDLDTNEINISESDINQNQLPRGGIIVSLGSTSGLGYAPLVGAKVKAVLDNSNGSIISVVGIATTGNPIAFTTVSYNNQSGILDIFSTSIGELSGVNQVKLVGLGFTCPSNPGIVSYFPSHNDSLNIIGIGTTSFSVRVGTSTLPHYYVGYGTIYPWYENLNFGSGYRNPVSVAVTEKNHVGSAATITATVGAGGTLSFNIIGMGTGYSNPTIAISPPSYENLNVIGVSRLGIGQTTDTGIGLLLNVEVGASRTTGIGSTYFEVSSFKVTRSGYNFRRGDIFKPVGLVTAQGLDSPLEEFRLTVLETYNDSFAAWQFGEMNLIDSVKKYQDGKRTNFPLYYNNELLSFQTNVDDPDSQVIDFDSLLVIFINGILQEPKIVYEFVGGSAVRFLTAPKKDDNVEIYFYVGTRGSDSEQFDVNSPIQIGDTLQVYSNNSNLPTTITQNPRTIFDILSSSLLETNLYSDQGIDSSNLKPVYWTKQKEDLIINETIYSKSRSSLEPQIYPTSKIIKNVTSSDNEIFVDSLGIFNYEEEIPNETFNLIIIPSEQSVQVGIVTAVVSASGTIQSLNIENSGSGYGNYTPSIKISNPYTGITTFKIDNNTIGIGSTATAQLTVSNGSISNAIIVNPGLGYTNTNVPQVIVEEPPFSFENCSGANVAIGFDGIIVGIGTTVGVGTNLAMKFNLEKFSGNYSDLSVGYPIYVFDTNVGSGVTSIDSNDSQIVAISTSFVDNIYYVHNIDINTGTITCNILSNSTNVIGIATTGNTANPVGKFSWGKIGGIVRGTNPVSIGVSGYNINSGLSTYPSIQRRGYGLRKTGALKIDLSPA